VHLSATCEPRAPPLLTHVHTTAATGPEAQGPAPLQQALVEKALPPSAPLVDAAYISAAWLVQSRDEHRMTLRGPTRPSPGWQAHVDGA
jgi:transposase